MPPKEVDQLVARGSLTASVLVRAGTTILFTQALPALIALVFVLAAPRGRAIA